MSRNNTNNGLPVSETQQISLTSPPELFFSGYHQPGGKNIEFAKKVDAMDPNELVLFTDNGNCTTGIRGRASLMAVPEYGVGREMSSHGIGFGNLTVRISALPDFTEPVAVKPYDKRKTRLPLAAHAAVTHEIAASNWLESLFPGSTFRPQGIWRSPDTYKVPLLLTNFKSGATSLDTILRESDPSSAKVLTAWKMAHYMLGMIVGAGAIHGDAQIQNYAMHQSGVLFNDTTTIRPLSRTNTARNTALVQNDVGELTASAFYTRVSTRGSRRATEMLFTNGRIVDYLWQNFQRGVVLAASKRGVSPDGVVDEAYHKSAIRKALESNPDS